MEKKEFVIDDYHFTIENCKTYFEIFAKKNDVIYNLPISTTILQKKKSRQQRKKYSFEDAVECFQKRLVQICDTNEQKNMDNSTDSSILTIKIGDRQFKMYHIDNKLQAMVHDIVHRNKKSIKIADDGINGNIIHFKRIFRKDWKTNDHYKMIDKFHDLGVIIGAFIETNYSLTTSRISINNRLADFRKYIYDVCDSFSLGNKHGIYTTLCIGGEFIKYYNQCDIFKTVGDVQEKMEKNNYEYIINATSRGNYLFLNVASLGGIVNMKMTYYSRITSSYEGNVQQIIEAIKAIKSLISADDNDKLRRTDFEPCDIIIQLLRVLQISSICKLILNYVYMKVEGK